MSGARVHASREGPVATVYLDGPERHNVLDRDDWVELARVLDELGSDGSLRCLVVRGMGGRAFSTGSDIRAFADQRETEEDVRRYSRAIGGTLAAVARCAQPTVAVIEGLCVGGGLEIAASCDLRICGTSSRFGAPIARLGLTMSYEELTPLVALLGPGPVLELLLTGELIEAERAYQLGVVSRVVPDARVVAEGYALAARVAEGAPLVHRWHKRFVRRLLERRALTDEERDEVHEAFRTRDYREGRAAFLEKRAPDFEGA